MTPSELAQPPSAGRGDPASRARDRGGGQELWLTGLVVVLTALGAVLRLIVAHQSIFADELSTYWISATHSLSGVLSLMWGTGSIKHAEITPPLYFVLAWVSTRLGRSPELLRLPSLIAGTITIPVVYLIGLRTLTRRGALFATAFVTVAPFMVYYSGDARAYSVMMLAVLVSTLAMLKALDSGVVWWWVLYAVGACAAFYSHYTCTFVLAVQLAWVLVFHPTARRAALTATVGAAVAVLPWAPGLIKDLTSPTVKILNALSPFTFADIRIDLGHWVIGYPETFAGGLSRLPGTVGLILLAIGVLIGVGSLLLAGRGASWRARVVSVDRRTWLVVALAVTTPVAELVLGAFGQSIFSVRDLAASWPYLALSAGAVLAACELRPALISCALGLAAMTLGSVKMLGGPFQRPDYQSAARYIEQTARPGDVVIDETGALTPGPLTGLDAALRRPLRIIRAEAPAERGHPFGFSDPVVPLQTAVDQAVRVARGHRILLVRSVFVINIGTLANRTTAAQAPLPTRYRLTAERRYADIGHTLVALYTDTDSSTR